MDSSRTSEDEVWERCKENVQLLRGGRSVGSLNMALRAPESNGMSVLYEQQRQFELELRFYEGDDPLGVWDRYIAWTEQMFPQGGIDSQLQALLERLLKTFVDDERYKNSECFLNHCLKLANMMKEPLEVFSFLFNRGIGRALAQLYVAWAKEYETRGDIGKADEVYLLGFENRAQPTELLERYSRHFDARMVRRVAAQLTDNTEEKGQTTSLHEESRVVLRELKTIGKERCLAPINRMGSAIEGATQLPLPQAQHQQRSKTEPFYVFEEQGANAVAQEISLPQPVSLPVALPCVKETENKPHAHHISSLRSHLKTDTGLVSDIVPFQDNAELMTPRCVQPLTDVLSTRESLPETDLATILQSFDPDPKPRELRMYCWKLVFGGPHELSFEEIHAERYRQQQARRAGAISKKPCENLKSQADVEASLSVQLEDCDRLPLQDQEREHEGLRQQERERLLRERLCLIEQEREQEHERVHLLEQEHRRELLRLQEQQERELLHLREQVRMQEQEHMQEQERERLRKEEQEHEWLRKEEQECERLRKEEKEREWLRKAEQERERLRKEEQERERLRKEEQECERLRKEEQERERLRKEEQECERLRKEEQEHERLQKEEQERERLRMQEQERLRKEEQERERLRMQEEKREWLQEQERLRKQEQERLRMQEQERLRMQEQERLRMQEQERLRMQEQERLRMQEQERLRMQEQERLRMQEQERLRMQEQDRLRMQEQERLRMQEQERLRMQEQERLRMQEREWLRMQEQERERLRLQEQERERLRMQQQERERLRMQQQERERLRLQEQGSLLREELNMKDWRSQHEETLPAERSSVVPSIALHVDKPYPTELETLPFTEIAPTYQAGRTSVTEKCLFNLTQKYGEQGEAAKFASALGAVPKKHETDTVSQVSCPTDKPSNLNQSQLTATWPQSPTQHTREAIQDVMHMFGVPPLRDEEGEGEKDFERMFQKQSADAPVQNSGSFCPPRLPVMAPPFAVFVDKDQENEPVTQCPRSPTSRKPLSIVDSIKAEGSEEECKNGEELLQDTCLLKWQSTTMCHTFNFSPTNTCTFARHAMLVSTPCNPLAAAESPSMGEHVHPAEKPCADVVSSDLKANVDMFEQQGKKLSPIIETSIDTRSSSSSSSISANSSVKTLQSTRSGPLFEIPKPVDSHLNTKTPQLPVACPMRPVANVSQEQKAAEESDVVERLSEHVRRRHLDGPPATQSERLPFGSAAGNIIDDPWSEVLLSQLMQSLPKPITSHPHLHSYSGAMPIVRPGNTITLGSTEFQVHNLVGEGAFAKVYGATQIQTKNPNQRSQIVVLKVQQRSCAWEFYIYQKLAQRLAPTDLPIFMSVHSAHMFSKGSVLVGDMYNFGSLLDVANWLKNQDIVKKQLLSMYFAVLVMYAVERLHKDGIIHADIKPDNFLLAERFSKNAGDLDDLVSSGLVLLDFGQSIDLQLFQLGTRFRGSSKTQSFCCPEMLHDQPWTIQPDLFAVASTVHCLLFGEYMKVQHDGNTWRICCAFKRWHKKQWQQFFHDLLNTGRGQSNTLYNLRTLLTNTLKTEARWHLQMACSDLSRFLKESHGSLHKTAR
uniref:uncharacterized protein isoform X3 n=1 Tax=Myxine glutinosa TaxID=7769 RepID=UPI00358F1D01